jgi:ZF-HD homeobox protein with Cys/His-rich dimerization domain
MEAVVDVKYRPALFGHGGMVEAKKPEAIELAGVYLECLRNHAASAGGHVVDGCGEFMPALAAPLRCAACGCHRSFHRRAIAAEVPPSPHLALLPPAPPPSAIVVPVAPPLHLLRDGRGLLPRTEGAPKPEDRGADTAGGWGSDTDVEGSDYDDGRPMSPLPAPDPHMLALTPGAPATAMTWQPAAPAPVPSQGTAVPGAPLASAWKRLRSKFSPEQKRRMRVLSERLGWRLQRRWRTAAARSASPGASSRSGCTTTSTTSSAASTARAARPRRLLPSRLRPPSLHRTLPSPPRPHRPRRLQHQRHRRRWGRRPESS